MTERLQLSKFLMDANQMAILEANWVRAWEMGDEREFKMYFETGLKLQYHLNAHSAEEATNYLLEFLREPDLATKEKNLFQYHKILSEASGLGFDPDLTTKVWLGIEQSGVATVGQTSKYRSIIYGGLSGKDLFRSTQIRNNALDEYQASREVEKSEEDKGKAFANLVGQLAESYSLLNIALVSSSGPLEQ